MMHRPDGHPSWSFSILPGSTWVRAKAKEGPMREWCDETTRKRVRFACALLILTGAGASRTLAIPAFARKYQTSCQTCHVAFPMLTPFGEAFRLNGYRFPAGTDPNMVKTPPVTLGAEGYKKLWPKAVWPGEIPGLPPVAI